MGSVVRKTDLVWVYDWVEHKTDEHCKSLLLSLNMRVLLSRQV
jgi:hypothetical protein